MSNLDGMNVFGNSSNADKSDYNEFASVGKAEPNRKYKDTFFCKLFSEPEYTLKLYQQLHPEDKKATVDDIELNTFGGQSSLEVEVKVLCGEDASTIETGYNNDRVIDDYCNMIRCIEHNRSVMGLEGAITYAIHLFENTSLGDYLRRKKNEVENMLKDEYKEEDRVKALVQEGREENKAEMLKDFKTEYPNVSNEKIASIFHLTAEEVQKYLEAEV